MPFYWLDGNQMVLERVPCGHMVICLLSDRVRQQAKHPILFSSMYHLSKQRQQHNGLAHRELHDHGSRAVSSRSLHLFCARSLDGRTVLGRPAELGIIAMKLGCSMDSCLLLEEREQSYAIINLLHMDWGCILTYTCVQCDHNASLTTFGSGLADRIAFCPQDVSSAFTPLLSFGQAGFDLLSDHILMKV